MLRFFFYFYVHVNGRAHRWLKSSKEFKRMNNSKTREHKVFRKRMRILIRYPFLIKKSEKTLNVFEEKYSNTYIQY